MHSARHRFGSGAIRLCACAAAALFSLSASACLGAQSSGTLAERVQRIMDRPDFRRAFFGIEFYSLDSSQAIYSLNAEKLFVPGSTTKLLTEGTALELLGADYRFHTRVYRTGGIDSATFRTALPILGRDGTLWNIQPSSPAAGHVFAKTGTFATYDPLNRRLLITGKGLAGYITTADNRHLAFAIYVNNVSVSTEANAATAVVGQAIGEIAAAAYEAKR